MNSYKLEYTLLKLIVTASEFQKCNLKFRKTIEKNDMQ